MRILCNLNPSSNFLMLTQTELKLFYYFSISFHLLLLTLKSIIQVTFFLKKKYISNALTSCF